MSDSYLEIQLAQQPIELCKLLKIANMVSGGGEAKVVISEGYVVLNGEVEFQKRKKIYHHDIIEFNNEIIQVVINESLADQNSSAPDENIENEYEPKSIDKKHEPIKKETSSQRKRKPISF